MKKSGLVIERLIQIKATFNGMPIDGPVELLNNCKTFLSVNWEGQVEQVLTMPLEKIKANWFEPSDKGGLALFGVNEMGQVVCGMAFYKSGTHENPKAHYEVVACKSTQTQPW